MPFQRKGTVIGTSHRPQSKPDQQHLTGVRPSPLDGRLTVSTGTASLDQFFGGHSGLPLGTSVLVEESGATDFSGVLARYYAAEGLVQGHHVHVLGHGDAWKSDLPGLTVNGGPPPTSRSSEGDGMKIAWRYERLGNEVSRTRADHQMVSKPSLTDAFCHTFDLTKRLDSKNIRGTLIPHPMTPLPSKRHGNDPHGTLFRASVLQGFIHSLAEAFETSPRGVIHRVVVPSFLSPALYSPTTCSLPDDVLRFIHGLRALLRRHSERVSAMVTLPISLYPRPSGLTRWLEKLSDAVFELRVLPMAPQHGNAQGLFDIHALPIYQERGGGPQTGGSHANLSFKLSGPGGLVIEKFSLPPIDGEDETEKGRVGNNHEKLEF